MSEETPQQPQQSQTPPKQEAPPAQSPQGSQGTQATSPSPEPPAESKSGEPSVIQRIGETQAKTQFDKKYAFWTWCPSRGMLYDGKFPGGEVVVAPMTVMEEKLLADAGKDRSEIMNTIINRCLVDCPVPLDKLLIQDMMYLLLVIRNISYGADYKFTLTCPKCRLEYQKQMEIPGELKLRCLGDDDAGEPWEVKLPVSGDTIHWRHLRVEDETDIRRFSKDAYQSSTQQGNPGYIYGLAKRVVRINGEVPHPTRRLDYVENMIAADSLAFRNDMEKRDFGVSIMLESLCPRCGNEAKVRLPFDREFFHPSSS